MFEKSPLNDDERFLCFRLNLTVSMSMLINCVVYIVSLFRFN